MASRDKPASVCIIGGGPVGLTTALALAEYGVRDIVILERAENLATQRWNPALGFHPSSVALYHKFNVLTPLLESAVPMDSVCLLVGSELLLCTAQPQLSPADRLCQPQLSRSLALNPADLNRVLVSALEQRHGISIIFGATVHNIELINEQPMEMGGNCPQHELTASKAATCTAGRRDFAHVAGTISPDRLKAGRANVNVIYSLGKKASPPSAEESDDAEAEAPRISLSATFLVGCDGWGGVVRKSFRIPTCPKFHPLPPHRAYIGDCSVEWDFPRKPSCAYFITGTNGMALFFPMWKNRRHDGSLVRSDASCAQAPGASEPTSPEHEPGPSRSVTLHDSTSSHSSSNSHSSSANPLTSRPSLTSVTPPPLGTTNPCTSTRYRVVVNLFGDDADSAGSGCGLRYVKLDAKGTSARISGPRRRVDDGTLIAGRTAAGPFGVLQDALQRVVGDNNIRLSNPEFVGPPLTFSPQVSENLVTGGGCCFVLGDAAHRIPPLGGQGLNMSVKVADNLAWRLAGILQGKLVPETAILAYAEEATSLVHDVAGKVCSYAARAFTPTNLLHRATQHSTALALLTQIAGLACVRRTFQTRFSIMQKLLMGYHYPMDRLGIADDYSPRGFAKTDAVPGARAPEGAFVIIPHRTMWMHDYLTRRQGLWTLLGFTGGRELGEKAAPDALVEMLRTAVLIARTGSPVIPPDDLRKENDEILVNKIMGGPRKDVHHEREPCCQHLLQALLLVRGSGRISLFDTQAWAEDIGSDALGEIHDAFGIKKASFVLIRPDGHIACRGLIFGDAGRLFNYLRATFTIARHSGAPAPPPGEVSQKQLPPTAPELAASEAAR